MNVQSTGVAALLARALDVGDVRHRWLWVCTIPIVVIGIGSIPAATRTVVSAQATTQPGQADDSATPRTPDGRPDLQGIWNFSSVTPMERPPELEGKAELTEAEAAEFQRTLDEDRRDRETNSWTFKTGYSAEVWFEDGRRQKLTRSSLVIDPPDGRIPVMTPQAQERIAESRDAMERSEGPEDRWLSERCVVGFNAGPPMIPGAYNNNVHILQTAGQVVLVTEMIHNARIVPMDGQPVLAASMREWGGDSRGRWDGDTLVVETTNFRAKTESRPGVEPGYSWHRAVPDKGSDLLRVTERFTRIAGDALLYEFTVDDPGTYTGPWTARIEMSRADDPMYEYACHEGNYAMFGMLSGRAGGLSRDQRVDPNEGAAGWRASRSR